MEKSTEFEEGAFIPETFSALITYRPEAKLEGTTNVNEVPSDETLEGATGPPIPAVNVGLFMTTCVWLEKPVPVKVTV